MHPGVTGRGFRVTFYSRIKRAQFLKQWQIPTFTFINGWLTKLRHSHCLPKPEGEASFTSSVFGRASNSQTCTLSVCFCFSRSGQRCLSCSRCPLPSSAVCQEREHNHTDCRPKNKNVMNTDYCWQQSLMLGKYYKKAITEHIMHVIMIASQNVENFAINNVCLISPPNVRI